MAESPEALRRLAAQQQDLSNLDLIPNDELQLIKDATFKFQGDCTILGSAIGCLFLCKVYGYKIVRLSYDRGTLAKYEKVFQAANPAFKFKNYAAELGPLARRSVGYRIFETVGRWWDIVSGKISGRGPMVDLGIDSAEETA